MRVCHVITSLATGGAQIMLRKLLAALSDSAVRSSVITLSGNGPVAAQIRELGVPVHSMSMRPGFPDPVAMLRLARRLRTEAPDVVQTWMYHADCIGGLAARLGGNRPVVWNVRHSTLDEGVDKLTTRWTVKLNAWLSHKLPARIVVNSQAGARSHQDLGFDRRRLVVIPNGFDLDQFRAAPASRERIRRELKIDESLAVVGLIGRFHPHKGLRTLIDAAAEIARARDDVRFVLVGPELVWDTSPLAAWIRGHRLEQCFHLLGRRHDIPEVLSSFDTLICPSWTEAFPNVIGEAMSCCVPCVATDVGDSALIIGDTGIVVPPQNAPALAQGVLTLLAHSRSSLAALGQHARQRIADNYAIDRIAHDYVRLWSHVCESPSVVSEAIRQDASARAA